MKKSAAEERPSVEGHHWLPVWMQKKGVSLWGTADLTAFATLRSPGGGGYPRAVSFALPMDAEIMTGIQNGPNAAYAAEYARVNECIDRLSESLAHTIQTKGAHASALAASRRTDPVRILGDFPHKTAAVRAGLGWIGRNCQLIVRDFGPWVRLGTVFTDLDIPVGQPATRSHCGICRQCVERCPAGALTGEHWQPGLPREALLNPQVCDSWKKKHYPQYHNGQNCGICAAVCPYGRKPTAAGRKAAGKG